MPPQAGVAYGVKRPRSTVAPQKRILTAFWSGFSCAAASCGCRGVELVCAGLSLLDFGRERAFVVCIGSLEVPGLGVGLVVSGWLKVRLDFRSSKATALGWVLPTTVGCWYVPPGLVTRNTRTYPGCQ